MIVLFCNENGLYIGQSESIDKWFEERFKSRDPITRIEEFLNNYKLKSNECNFEFQHEFLPGPYYCEKDNWDSYQFIVDEKPRTIAITQTEIKIIKKMELI